MNESDLEKSLREEQMRAPHDHRMPGTIVLVVILLIAFAVYYFANWKALADVWHVR